MNKKEFACSNDYEEGREKVLVKRRFEKKNIKKKLNKFDEINMFKKVINL